MQLHRSTRQRATTLVISGIAVAFSPPLAAAQVYGAPYGAAQHAAQQFEVAIDESRGLIADFMTRRGVPGLSVAVAVEGEIVWSEGFGYANVEYRVPVTTLTRFRSGSVAKPITAAAMAVLYERGVFDLDAPIQQYVPSFPDKRYVITARQLAGHLAGIRYYPPEGDEFFNTIRFTNLVDALAVFKDDPLLFEPGTQYRYSSYGTNLLGAAIESAAGKHFLSVLRQSVFEPLKMRSTLGDHSDSIIPHRTSYYERSGQTPSFFQKPASWGDGSGLGVLLNGPFADNSNKWPGGGLLTTPEDLARFGSAHLEPGFLQAETLAMLFTSQHTASGEETGYGMNWNVGVDDEGRRTYSHGGGSIGGTSILRLYPDDKIVIAMQCNLTRANYQDLPQQIAGLFTASEDRGGQ